MNGRHESLERSNFGRHRIRLPILPRRRALASASARNVSVAGSKVRVRTVASECSP